MKILLRHSFLAALLLFVFLTLKNYLPFTAFIGCGLLYYSRTHDRTVIVFIFLMLIGCIPRFQTSLPDWNEGRVIEVRDKYVVVRNHFQKVIVYTDEELILDSSIYYDSDYEPIISTDGFYKFNFRNYCSSKGIYYSIHPESVCTKKDSVSLRGHIHKYILHRFNEEKKTLLCEILLGIRSSDLEFESFLRDT